MQTFTLLAALSLLAPAWSQITEAPALVTPSPSIACPQTELMPSCGVACVSAAAHSVGCTAVMDFACQCEHGPAMQQYVMPCVAAACGTAAPVVGSVANAICTACVATPTAVATAVGA
ncbi:hypothetical protein B0H67DRAFT_649802 [Lasiosphaeris hirsuta]|uniref:CFEM domain-containing protein n=1 Tax=Lasiosphaeris hirsuta TaxID=260670 RepID=A0AA39ZXM8_9PEZI|nr:hypothetical protein B0H67DRAFT_649802 [Lasiosphaeris hirsuta]